MTQKRPRMSLCRALGVAASPRNAPVDLPAVANGIRGLAQRPSALTTPPARLRPPTGWMGGLSPGPTEIGDAPPEGHRHGLLLGSQTVDLNQGCANEGRAG